MRRTLPPLAALIFSLSALLITWASAQTTVTVTLPQRAILQGETVIVEGVIDCPGFCSGFDITVQYDRSILRVENAVVGGYLGAPDAIIMPPNGILFDFASGLVRIAADSSAGAPGETNALFMLIVTGLSPGISPLRIINLQINGDTVDQTQVFGVDGAIAVRTPPPLLRVTRELEVRSGPSTLFEPLEMLQPNVTFEIIGISADGAWFQVVLANGAAGWVAAGSPFIETEGNLAALPFITTPTPSPSRTARPSRTPRPTITPTLAPSATFTPTAPPEPEFGYLVATTNANIRSGDGTNFGVIGSLPQGERAVVLGLSSTGTGWFYIQFANEQLGWISPIVVTYERALDGLPLIVPPEPPAPVIATLPVTETLTVQPTQAPTSQATDAPPPATDAPTQAPPPTTAALEPTDAAPTPTLNFEGGA